MIALLTLTFKLSQLRLVDVQILKLISSLVYLDLSPSSGDVDEFCPRMDEANMMILKQIGDHADDTAIYSTPTNKMTSSGDANESDSDNELLPKNAVIPEPDDVDSNLDHNEDFLSSQNNHMVLTQSAEYKRKHFSNTSSESSDTDDSITRGLDFKNIPVTATIEPHTSPSASAQNLLTNIQNTITRNLIETIVRPSSSSQQKKATTLDSDEDSDFEILDSEDFAK